MKAPLLAAIVLAAAGMSGNALSDTGNVDVYGNFPISISTNGAYRITFSGTLEDTITGTVDPGFGLDMGQWLGKTYSLGFVLHADPAQASASGVAGSSRIPGNVFHWWNFDAAGAYPAGLAIDGVSVFSGADLFKNQVITDDNQWLPENLPGLPAGIQGGHAYDGLLLETGRTVGCDGGPCDGSNLGQVHRELWIGVGHMWSDTDVLGTGLPDLSQALPYAGAQYARMYIAAGLWNPDGSVHETLFTLEGSIDNIAVEVLANPVPEPETYGLLLAGLALLAGRLRGRVKHSSRV